MRTNRPGYQPVVIHRPNKPMTHTVHISDKLAQFDVNLSAQAIRLLRGVASRQEIRFQCSFSASRWALFTAKFPNNESVSFSLPDVFCGRIQPGQRVPFHISLEGQNGFTLTSPLIDIFPPREPGAGSQISPGFL